MLGYIFGTKKLLVYLLYNLILFGTSHSLLHDLINIDQVTVYLNTTDSISSIQSEALTTQVQTKASIPAVALVTRSRNGRSRSFVGTSPITTEKYSTRIKIETTTDLTSKSTKISDTSVSEYTNKPTTISSVTKNPSTISVSVKTTNLKPSNWDSTKFGNTITTTHFSTRIPSKTATVVVDVTSPRSSDLTSKSVEFSTSRDMTSFIGDLGATPVTMEATNDWTSTKSSKSTTRHLLTTDPTDATSKTLSSKTYCDEETLNGVTWPRTSEKTLTTSSPLCLDSNLKIIKRACNEGEWEPAPTCSSTQHPIEPCPHDLQWTLGAYCVKIFEKTTFPPLCPYPDMVNFDEYVNLNLTSNAFWMPLQRTNDEKGGGIGLMSWLEKNENYKLPYLFCDTSYCKKYFFGGTIMDKNCLLYHNSSHIEAVMCDTKHTALCVYRPLHQKERSYCSQTYGYKDIECKQSEYEADSNCFCKGLIGPENTPNEGQPAAEFVYSYQNFLYNNITEENCSFGLKQLNNGTFVWSNSNAVVTYTNWSNTTDINFDYTYGVLSKDGWNLEEQIEENSCLIYQVQPEYLAYEILLTYETKEDLFTLQLANTSMWYHGSDGTPLVFCFTNADAKTLSYRISTFKKHITVNSSVYSFPPLGSFQSGPGEYWCEAFLYPEMKTIRTENKILNNILFTGEYVAILKITDYVTKNYFGDNPLTPTNVAMMQNLFKNELDKNPNTNFYPRIFKILDVNEILHEITINFHLTSSLSENTRSEYYILKDIVQNQTIFEYIDFRSVHYCYEKTEILNNVIITWPPTPLNHNGKIPGYCVSDQGEIINKKCVGNFTDGAIWADTSTNCSFYAQSKTTNALLKILDEDEPLKMFDELMLLLENPNVFSAFDVFLITKYLNKLINQTIPDLIKFGQVLDKVINIPRIVLLAAQSNFKATDKILGYVDSILTNQNTLTKSLEQKDVLYSFNSFICVVVNIKPTFKGIALQNCSDTMNCSVINLSNSSSVILRDTEIASNIYAAVVLSDELLDQILVFSNKNESFIPRIAIAIYLNSVFFNEIIGKKNTSVVFGILLPDFTETFKGPITLVFNNNLNFSDQKCSFWKYGKTDSSSEWEYENSTDTNGATYCDYYHLTNLAIISGDQKCSHESLNKTKQQKIKTDTKISNELKAILKDSEISRKLKRLKDVSKFFKDFNSNHIKLFSEGLVNITINNEKQLRTLKLIISNVSKFSKGTLKESQVKYHAADKLIENMSIIIDKLNNKLFSATHAVFNFNGNFPKNTFGHLLHHNATDITLLIGNNQENLEISKNIDFPKPNNNEFLLTIKVNNSFQTEVITKNFQSEKPSFSENFANTILLLYHDTDFCYIPNRIESDYLKMCTEISLDQNTSKLNYNSKTSNEKLTFLNTKTDAIKTLEGILPELSAKETVAKLQNILKKTPKKTIQSAEVAIIAEILYSLSKTSVGYNHDELRKFVYILDRIISFNKTVVAEAQHFNQSADKILAATKNVLGGFYRYTAIEARNFGLVISAKKINSNSGKVYVTKSKGHWSTSLAKTTNITNENVVLKFTVDDKLLDQINNFTVLVFYKNTLFSTKSELISKPIIKILFPNVQEPLQGYISLTYYNISSFFSSLAMCSYYNYDVFTKKIGNWYQETSPILTPSIVGDRVTCKFNHTTNFALVVTPQNITTNLEGILNSNLTGDQKLKLVNQITNDVSKHFSPIDIYIISEIFQETLNISSINPDMTSSIVSNLFNVPRDVLKKSQKTFNATDKILYAIDQMAMQIDRTTISHPNFALVVRTLEDTGLVGVFLENCAENVCNVLPIDSTNFDNTPFNSTSALVLFSDSLIQQIKSVNNTKVVITIFYDNSLFNEYNTSRSTSKVFGVCFPGIKEKLNGTVSVAFKMDKMFSDICAYWKYSVNTTHPENNQRGTWQNDINTVNQHNLMICNFSHVTHFALLLADSEEEYMHDAALSVITNVNCILSLIGLIGIILTAILFERWRNNTGNKILVNNAIAITMKITMLYISDFMFENNSASTSCTIMGMGLHYSMLSECCWMLIIAILQFKRFVEVLGGPPKYVMIKALICGWVFPVIPVLSVILIDPDNYVNNTVGICYPTKLGLYLGVWLPVSIILFINCIIFVFIMYNICKKKTECVEPLNNELLFQWRLALLLFFILGITWIFGFLAQIKGDVVFIYIFCITSTLQGFVMFWFFIVFNKSTRSLYMQAIKQWFYERGILTLKQRKSSKY